MEEKKHVTGNEVMQPEQMLACRKCGVENPAINQYCRKCGAVLRISTSVVRAQRSPVKPRDTRFKWRYVGIGLFVMLGIAAVALALAFFLGLRISVDEGGGLSGLFAFSLTVGVIFLVSFGLSGGLLGILAGRSVSRESFVAASLVVLLLGGIGATVSSDLLITAGLLLLPTGVSAWLGSRLRGRGKG